MIIKVVHRADSIDALHYGARTGAWSTSDGPAKEIAGALPFGVPLTEWKREFERVEKLRPKIKQNVVHIAVSMAEQDRKIPPSELAEIARATLDGLGLGDGPWRATLHVDGHTQHIHIVSSLLDYQGQRADMTGERWKSLRLARALELEHRLWRLSSRRGEPLLPPLSFPGEKNPEISKAKPESPGFRDHVREVVRRVLKDGMTLPELRDELAVHQVALVCKFSLDGSKISGLGFRAGDAFLKASLVDRQYSLPGLQKLGVRYEPARDIPLLSPPTAPLPIVLPPPMTLPTPPVLPAPIVIVGLFPSLPPSVRLPEVTLVAKPEPEPRSFFNRARDFIVGFWEVLRSSSRPGRSHLDAPQR